MLRSKWLPTMPVHAANWLADPRVQMLPPAARCELLEALLRSWMLGRAIPVQEEIADAYAGLWPEYEQVRVANLESYARRQKQTEAARQARHAARVTVSVTEIVTTTVEGPEQRLSLTEPKPKPKPSSSSSPVETLYLQDSTVGAAARAPKPRTWRRAPRDYVPPRETLMWAYERGLEPREIREEYDAFMRCEFSKAHSDVDATFRNWLHREAKEKRRRERPRGRDQQTQDAISALLEGWQHEQLLEG